MKDTLIETAERLWVSVPLKDRHNKHLTRDNWNWTVFEIIKLRTFGGISGYGETMIYYTWGKVLEEKLERVKGRNPFELMWDDSLGAGLQMALFGLAGKILEVPCHHLLGRKVRDRCPVSWWSNDMPEEDWIEEVKEAVSRGFTSMKLKARPWRDFLSQLNALANEFPSGTHLQVDADFNGFLRDAGTAVPYLLALEENPLTTIFETPIPQVDAQGSLSIRNRIHRPIAMHYGKPPANVAVTNGICDGFVIGGGAGKIRQDADTAAEMNMPFWLQMVGTGITTAFMLHLGATLTHAVWPAVTCLNIYQSSLIRQGFDVYHGYASVPERPGLGFDLDEQAVAKFRVEEGYEPPPPDNLYRVVWSDGSASVYAPGKRGLSTTHVLPDVCLWEDFTSGNQPLFQDGVHLEILPNDGSETWRGMARRAQEAPIREKGDSLK